MLPAKTGSIRILLADDHPAFRQGVRSFLDSFPDIEVVGEAENGEEVIHSVPYICPSAIVMDIHMPKLNGIEATRSIKADYPHVAIVGLSAHADSFFQAAMIAAGAKSVVPKEMATELLYPHIKAEVEKSTEHKPRPKNCKSNKF